MLQETSRIDSKKDALCLGSCFSIGCSSLTKRGKIAFKVSMNQVSKAFSYKETECVTTFKHADFKQPFSFLHTFPGLLERRPIPETIVCET